MRVAIRAASHTRVRVVGASAAASSATSSHELASLLRYRHCADSGHGACVSAAVAAAAAAASFLVVGASSGGSVQCEAWWPRRQRPASGSHGNNQPLAEQHRAACEARTPNAGEMPDVPAVLDELRGKVVSVHVVNAGAPAGAPAPPSHRDHKVLGRHVSLESLREEDVTFLGSGFVYGNGTFAATCAHLFDGLEAHVATAAEAASASGGGAGDVPQLTLALRFGNGDWAAATLWGSSAAADIAVLKLDQPSASGALRLAASSAALRQGDWVVACGANQYCREVLGVAGVVSQPRQVLRGVTQDPGVPLVQLAVTTFPGMSGSPVVDGKGNLVGMLAKKFEEHGLALPAARVAVVARCLERYRAWSPPVLGMELSGGGTLCSPCVMVRSVRAGGPAETAGVQPGDVVLAVGDSTVASVTDVRAVLADIAVGVAADADATVDDKLSCPDTDCIPVSLGLQREGRTLHVLLLTPNGA